MEQKFIYVFDEDARDKLVALKFVLIKTDTRNGIYIFENNGNTSLIDGEIQYILSNTISL